MADTVIYGGTFNPPHIAHKMIMELLAADKETERLLVIPTFVPPHKEYVAQVDDIHRLNMCRLAAKGIKNAAVSDIELRRGGKSYTVDTLEQLEKQYGNSSFAVACGGDMLITLDTWKNYPKLIKTAKIIALYRQGTDEAKFGDAIKMIENDGGRVKVINVSLPRVASKDIRSLIKAGEPVDEYIPFEVMEYIKENKLYL